MFSTSIQSLLVINWHFFVGNMLRPRPISEDVRLRIVWNQEDEDSVYTRDSEEYSELEEGVPELRQVGER